ncbi:MAG: DUF2236 domain-containing protein [Sphingobacteriaceae bacterium]|nr:DUF2236 domain-containing protein [Sphingobacteriaceae bacterium]
MKLFVNKDSIVRKIWGCSDTILFIFAGASAEFALNKAVDWLYFTGKLPADPLGRLFSTVAYARQIVFSNHHDALVAIDKITAIHKGVEQSRGSQIPDWAYRDVLFMLIDYSIRAFEVLERKLTGAEKTEVFEVFNRVGNRMRIKGLPTNYTEWLNMREKGLAENLISSKFTGDLFEQYEKHLGWFRYRILREAQVLIVPRRVNKLLSLGGIPFLIPVLQVYKLFKLLQAEAVLKKVILPEGYQRQIAMFDSN